MAQRKSGYARQARELYETRERWVVEALGEHVRLAGLTVWEPAAGSGKLAAHLTAAGATVWESDLEPQPQRGLVGSLEGVDFTTARWAPRVEAIVTNPPFGDQGRLGVAFIEAGLRWLRDPTSPIRTVAFLLSVDFDSGSTRVGLFRDCPEFFGKIVLLKRIRWFDGPSGPSTNHAWYIHTRREVGPRRPPVVMYAPTIEPAVDEPLLSIGAL